MIKTIWDKQYKLEIEIDYDNESPKNFSEWTIVMCSYFERKNIGKEYMSDNHNGTYYNFLDYINETFNLFNIKYGTLSEEQTKSVEDFIDSNLNVISLYVIEHSWFHLSMQPFCWIDDYNIDWFIYSKKETSLEQLENEIKIYNKFLSWECYKFTIYSRWSLEQNEIMYYTEWHAEDSIGWFYSLEDMLEYIPSNIFCKEDILNYEIK